ncbi:MAG: outer membrane protein assembly factor BamA [Alphaproteobacteria bacterium]|nr:outer membrane protein assembly factor BamA [Alphaproteobacteria bacterium]
MLRYVTFSLFLALALPVLAAPVTEIRVVGSERVEAETIRSYLPFKVGESFDEAQTGAVVRSLFATGLFANVELAQDPSGAVTVQVVENPLVNRVVFEGNKEVNRERLEEITQLKPRAIYSPAKVQADVQALQAAYRARGRFTTQVNAQLIQRDQNRVDVIYAIKEGEKTRIADISFVGNRKFSDSDLSAVIATKTSAWWRFLSSNDAYDPTRLEVDRDLLRRFYLQRGYADVQVTSAVAELSRDRKDFVITYTIFEGPQYDFGTVNMALQAEAEGLDMASLQPVVTLKPGELFDAKRVDDTTDKLIDALGSRGFAFLDVKPSYQKNEAERRVDITYAITPGPRVYVNRINIEGNTRTRDNVIRRELRLAEGDAFSSEKVKRSQDRLTYLGYFEKAEIARAETDQPDRMDLNVKVKEQSTGEFNIGAGYSTYDGLLTTANVRERNFLGRGQEVGIDYALSQRQQNFNLSFTEPYFMGQPLAVGGDVFNTRTDYQDESGYDTAVNGGAFRLGFPLDEFTRNDVRLGLKETKIEGIGSNANRFVRMEKLDRTALSLANTWAYDTRDSILNPTRGVRVAATGEYAGFGLDTSYLRGNLNGAYTYSIWEDWALTVGGRLGVIEPLGDDLPIYEHFMGGGQDMLRGFEYGGIGPRDRATNDALGGKYLVGHTVDLVFPISNALNELGVRGVLFTDGGMVTEFDRQSSAIIDDQTYRITAGAGLNWRSPIGPLRLQLGVPLVKAEGDREQIFSFAVGTRF